MKKLFLVLACLILTFTISGAQEKEQNEYKLMSEKLDQQGKELDAQTTSLSNKIAAIIKKYDLLKTSNIRFVPFQTTYDLGPGYIELEKHSFIKDDTASREVIGFQSKMMKIYTDGQTINKIESEIRDRDYYAGTSIYVKIVDPSPMAEGTDDIIFTHIINGKTYMDNKRMGDMKNTTAFPVRNELKREFLVPHYAYFMNSLLFIAESYYKGMKDTESNLQEFLKKSKKY